MWSGLLKPLEIKASVFTLFFPFTAGYLMLQGQKSSEFYTLQNYYLNQIHILI